ncbi:hypothetical protein ACFU6S_44325, partial [Streptomyces sp. NPDC057456]
PPVEQAKLLFPVTQAEESAIAALAKWQHRIGPNPPVSGGFNEKTDRTAGYFTWTPGEAKSWHDVILQGPLINVATPYHKQPPEGGSKSMRDYEAWDHRSLAVDAVPRTNYRRSATCSASNYYAALSRRSWTDWHLFTELQNDERVTAVLHELTDDEDERQATLQSWATRPYSRFFRLAWRRQIASNTERSLFAALIPPGPAHIHMMHSAALASSRETALTAGFWASLPLDYFLRATGRSDLQVGEAQVMPAPTADHPLEGALLLRTLRLNCQTNAYAPLWEELYDRAWQQDTWAATGTWPDSTPPLTAGVGRSWTRDTPLRTEFTRRAALVEIDALVAVWLGISADELVAMYDARFPVLQQY